MRRIALVVLFLALIPARAFAHVGSPDVFFEGDAGPYRLFVAIRTPQVIPGIATIEIRSESPDVQDVTVVPMRLTGPGSQLPPTPDHAERSAIDPKFFTASLWLMEHGSMQVRIAVDGARGHGQLAVPVPAFAQTTLTMTRGLGVVLLGLMALLAFAIVGIVSGAVREATLDAAIVPPRRSIVRARIAAIVIGAAVLGLIAAGNAWWNAEADNYERMVMKPWTVTPQLEGCRLVVPDVTVRLLPDHGHDMHLFLVRTPDLDRLVHVHPEHTPTGEFVQQVPSMAAGHYFVFVDIVLDTGFPITGTGTLDVPDQTCPPLTGDDSAWAGPPPHDQATIAELGDGTRMIWDRPPQLRANVAAPLRFHVENRDDTPAQLEPYMGMAGHAEIVRSDGSVFAHLHPNGSVAMPALELAQVGLGAAPMAAMPGMDHMGDGAMTHAMAMPAQDLAFPYGFPKPGTYRVFVQVKHAGQVVTGAFDARVE